MRCSYYLIDPSLKLIIRSKNLVKTNGPGTPNLVKMIGS